MDATSDVQTYVLVPLTKLCTVRKSLLVRVPHVICRPTNMKKEKKKRKYNREHTLSWFIQITNPLHFHWLRRPLQLIHALVYLSTGPAPAKCTFTLCTPEASMSLSYLHELICDLNISPQSSNLLHLHNLSVTYTASHEWVSVDGDIATVGITDYAQVCEMPSPFFYTQIS